MKRSLTIMLIGIVSVSIIATFLFVTLAANMTPKPSYYPVLNNSSDGLPFEVKGVSDAPVWVLVCINIDVSLKRYGQIINKIIDDTQQSALDDSRNLSALPLLANSLEKEIRYMAQIDNYVKIMEKTQPPVPPSFQEVTKYFSDFLLHQKERLIAYNQLIDGWMGDFPVSSSVRVSQFNDFIAESRNSASSIGIRLEQSLSAHMDQIRRDYLQ